MSVFEELAAERARGRRLICRKCCRTLTADFFYMRGDGDFMRTCKDCVDPDEALRVMRRECQMRRGHARRQPYGSD